MVGETLGNRYKIISKLGEGGMAEVYKAACLVLNRTVAVKVLRPQFASDEEFVERFRREAQAAASLSHPNIVGIYDVGHDGDRYYIVMEYVQGQSLRDTIRKSGPLPPARAAWLAWQILAALEHAHENNIVHRDIKPHNILVTPDGRVKVTDFGIARAASTSALTEAGTVIGTVNYFSPEQAKGDPVGVQSDIYSLGVVLYEMLTGRVPFKGESPISIALQHVQTSAAPPSQVNPSVPRALDRIVMKALEKNASRRYERARDMMRALEPYAFPGNGADSGDGVEDAERPTEVLRIPAAGKEAEDTLVKEPAQPAPRSSGFARAVAVTAVIVAVALGLAGLALVKLPEWLYVEEVRVPDFTGKTLEEARALAEQSKIRLDEPDWRYDDSVPPNAVISQRPGPYEKVKLNGRVSLVVSLGREMVEVPDLTGMDPRQARLELERLELVAGAESQGYSSDVERGKVLSQSPEPGRRVEKGAPVDIVLSAGPEPSLVVVPDLTGLAVADAERALSSVGLAMGSAKEEYREGVAPGLVAAQTPAAGELAAPGSAVDVVVSGGEEESSLLDAITPVSTLVTVVVPPGADTQEVRIRISDYYGERDYYVGSHSPGERIEKQVNAWGRRVRIRVYIGGVLYKDEWVP